MVDVALYEAVFNMMESLLPEYDMFGDIRERSGAGLPSIVPSNTYMTRDGKYVVIGANADSIFKRLMHAIGRDDLGQDPALGEQRRPGRAHGGDRRCDRRLGRRARPGCTCCSVEGGRSAERQDLRCRGHRRAIRTIRRAE